jgi:hypothetical protein
MKLKNVIIVNDFAHVNGGAGQVAFSSAKELAHRGFNVVVFSAVAPIDERLEFDRVKVVCLAQKDILTEKNRLRAIVQGCWNKNAKRTKKESKSGEMIDEIWIYCLLPMNNYTSIIRT